MSPPLPDDVTPAMLDPKAGACVACERVTDYVCGNCDEPLCDTDSCEGEHRNAVGHGPIWVREKIDRQSASSV